VKIEITKSNSYRRATYTLCTAISLIDLSQHHKKFTYKRNQQKITVRLKMNNKYLEFLLNDDDEHWVCLGIHGRQVCMWKWVRFMAALLSLSS